jgi:murein L,D-transpeptidase YcbB/YkuD
VNLLLNALLASKDARIWYIIFNGKIYNRKNNFKAEKYTGVNAHKHHLHLSVSDDPKLYDDAREWNLTSAANPEPVKTEPQTSLPNILKKGDKGVDVARLQKRLFELGFLKGRIDGDFGEATLAAVKSAQFAHKLDVDGIAGRQTFGALGLR